MMSEDEFWKVADGTAGDDVEAQAGAIDARLSAMSPDELLAYHRRFVELSNRSNTFTHLGAAQVIMGFVSDDAFDSFRTWVLYRGRDLYTDFVRDPDTLADHGPTDDEQVGAAEFLEFAALQRWMSQTGKEFPDLGDAGLYGAPTGAKIDTSYPSLATRFPKLAAAYLPDPAPTGSPWSDGPRPITRR